MEKIFLLVDSIESKGEIGITNDIKKVFRNIELLGADTEQDTFIHLPFVDEYLATVMRAGRFICVTRIKKDESSGSMILLDFRARSETKLEEISKVMFRMDLRIADLVMQHYRELREVFTPLVDVVELSTDSLV